MKKFLFIVVIVLGTVAAFGQTQNLFNPLPLNGTISNVRDTVTNTATAYLTSPLMSIAQVYTTTVQVNVTSISGTVGGTISLQGSLDGTNFVALTTEETQTALPTITAANASANYTWRIKGGPYPYYRVSWTGTGTMSASFTAKLFRNKYN